VPGNESGTVKRYARFARPGPTHLTSNLGPRRSRGSSPRVCDTSRSHLTCPHCSPLGQSASQPVKTRRAGNPRNKNRGNTDLPHTRVYIKYYDAVTFATTIRGLATASLVSPSIFLPLL